MRVDWMHPRACVCVCARARACHACVVAVWPSPYCLCETQVGICCYLLGVLPIIAGVAAQCNACARRMCADVAHASVRVCAFVCSVHHCMSGV